MVLVKQAHAENPPTADVDPPSIVQLFLDRGFMDRAVDLDLPQNGLRLRFATGDIPAPGVLNVVLQADLATSTPQGQTMFGPSYALVWTTNAAAVPTSVLVTLKAKGCGEDAYRQCALLETLNGTQRIIAPLEPTVGQATARVRLGATVRAVETVGYMTRGDASWYAYKECNCAASPDFAKGTYVLVMRADDPTRRVVVRINDWGPERDKFPKRVIDLDKVAFAAIGNPRGGVISVTVRPLASDDPLVVAAKAAEKAPVKAVASSVKPAAPVAQTASDDEDSGWSL